MDFQKVNVVAKFDAFPMPQAEEMVECISLSQYITTLDMIKRYWQIPMDHKDQEKTVFGSPWGISKFQGRPFGFHVPPLSFSA